MGGARPPGGPSYILHHPDRSVTIFTSDVFVGGYTSLAKTRLVYCAICPTVGRGDKSGSDVHVSPVPPLRPLLCYDGPLRYVGGGNPARA